MIYFIQESSDGPIKIGTATSVSGRFNSIQCGNPRKLRLLVVIDGGRTEEKKLHRRFEPWRIRGEWFQPIPELVELIDSLDSVEYNHGQVYSFAFPGDLRRAYEHLAADAGATVKLNDVVIQALRLALPVLKTGLTLEKFCVDREQDALDNWTAEHD